jgi:hypothetical protein
MIDFNTEFNKLLNEDVTALISDYVAPEEEGEVVVAEIEECPIYDLYNKISEIGLYVDHPMFKGDKTELYKHVRAVKTIIGRAAKKNPM